MIIQQEHNTFKSFQQGDPYKLCVRPECTTDPDCPSWLSCVQERCEDPCNCGEMAQCRVAFHRPQCVCPVGYEGDPHVRCALG